MMAHPGGLALTRQVAVAPPNGRRLTPTPYCQYSHAPLPNIKLRLHDPYAYSGPRVPEVVISMSDPSDTEGYAR